MAPVSYTLSQIIAALHTQWSDDVGTTRTWNDTSVEYSIPTTVPTGDATEQSGWRKMTATESSYARLAFELWDDLIAIDLNEVSDPNAQIAIGMSSTTKNGGTYTSKTLFPLEPGGSTFEREIQFQRIWLATGWTEFQPGNFQYGERGLETMLHEIGHSLGLSHPGPYNAGDSPAPTWGANALYTQDTLQWTIMSYFAAGADGTAVDRDGSAETRDADGDKVNATTPLLHDILAIQAKYGADMTTRTGNDTYGFNLHLSGEFRPIFDFTSAFNPNPVIAIWDAGGLDTLDVSGYSQDQRIDLHPGTISDVGALTQNVAIAYGATIEIAIGGSGDDNISGNDVDNSLFGNNGDDTLLGFGGKDRLEGGAGADHYDGGLGLDQAQFSSAVRVDLLSPGSNTGEAVGDTFVAVENMRGSAFDDTLLGDDAGNLIHGGIGTGADDLGGRGGDDVLVGFGGDDRLRGGTGGDRLLGGAGIDTVFYGVSAVSVDLANTFSGSGDAAGDFFDLVENATGSQGSDRLLGTSAANTLRGLEGNDLLNGRAGDDRLIGGLGHDRYILDSVSERFVLGKSIGEFYDRITESVNEGTDIVDVGRVASIKFPGLFISNYTLGSNVENGVVTGNGKFDLDGNELDNRLTGNDFTNILTGNDGNDTLIGGGGADRLEGGSGNDTYVLNNIHAIIVLGSPVGDSYDTVIEAAGGGVDTINVYRQSSISVPGTFITSYTLAAEIENGTIKGTGDFDVTGNGLSNVLTGNLASNILSGADGDDILIGGGGADRLIGGSGIDTASYRNAKVGLAADLTNEANNTGDAAGDRFSLTENLEGSDFADTLRGDTNDNHLNGGDGGDILEGRSGSDIAFGQGGDDVFVHALDDNFTESDFYDGGSGSSDRLVLHLTAAQRREIITSGARSAFNASDKDSSFDFGSFDLSFGFNLKVRHIEELVFDTSLDIDLAALTSAQGLRIFGADTNDAFGWSVSTAGDINGDGFDDIVLTSSFSNGSNNTLHYAGETVVVFGKSSGFSDIDVAKMAGRGFRIFGGDADDRMGYSARSAGDVNGDGFDDLIIGGKLGDGPANGRIDAGESILLFGTASPLADINLATLTKKQGIHIYGSDAGDQAGFAVSSAGDINGDGFDDIIIGANNADGLSNGKSNAGEAIIIFGKSSGFSDIDISTLTNAQGFRVIGFDEGDITGFSVASAGDMNGDGFDDIVIGSPGADGTSNDKSTAGEAVVLFGKNSGFHDIDLGTLTNGDGFRILDSRAGNYAGYSVNTAGDVNGDGLSDLVVGIPFSDGAAGDRPDSGEFAVIFGKSGAVSDVDLSNLSAADGFRVFGADGNATAGSHQYDELGFSVASAGDINGDGFDDVIIGTWLGDGPSNSRSDAGECLVLFGKASGFTDIDVRNLPLDSGLHIYGAEADDVTGFSVSSAGDINGDGFDDLVVGAEGGDGASGTKPLAGEGIVIFGSAEMGTASFVGTSADDKLVGSDADEAFVGGLGADELVGGGGLDAFSGGAGDDVIRTRSNAFFRIDGGSGADTLMLQGTGASLDFSKLGATSVTDIEHIDISGSGANGLKLSRLDLLDMSDAAFGWLTRIVVTGDADDKVASLDAGWNHTGTKTVGMNNFAVFRNGQAQLFVDTDIDTSGILLA